MNRYNLPGTSTPEKLEGGWRCTVDYGKRFLVAGYCYVPHNGCYFGAVYEHVDNDLTCNGNVKLIAVSDKLFDDNGHALEWAMRQ